VAPADDGATNIERQWFTGDGGRCITKDVVHEHRRDSGQHPLHQEGRFDRWGQNKRVDISVMGFFSRLFGGDDDKAAKWQREDNREAREWMKARTKEARDDAFRLFDQGISASREGAQRGLDILGQTIPERMRLVQQGRQRVQDTMLAGSEMYKRALLGLPTDMSILQKAPMNVNMDFASQRLPSLEAADAADAAAAETENNTGVPAPGSPEFYQMIANAMGGRYSGLPFGGNLQYTPPGQREPQNRLRSMRGYA